MSICTFFGHRNCPLSIYSELKTAIIDVIKNCGITEFLVGEEGGFDRMVLRILSELEKQYNIKYFVVKAYLNTPHKYDDRDIPDVNHCIIPPNFETVPPRFAIDFRNRYMLNQASFVICYVRTNYGGAAKFAELAKKQNKIVFNIADNKPSPQGEGGPC